METLINPIFVISSGAKSLVYGRFRGVEKPAFGFPELNQSFPLNHDSSQNGITIILFMRFEFNERKSRRLRANLVTLWRSTKEEQQLYEEYS